MGDCIFCKIIEGKAPSEKVGESENFIVINNINPVTEGHCLIIPKKHCKTIFDLNSALGNEMTKLIQEQGKRLMDNGAEGIKVVNNNYEAGGQVVFHLHIHIIPMYKDSENIGVV